jgi:serine/threonine-protein kinase
MTVYSLRNFTCGFFWLIATTTPLHVHAQPNTTVSREALALFNTARALMAEGKFAEACPVFEKARALYSGIGITFNLADCYEHIGLTASAWAGFQDTATAADIAGQHERAQVARQRAAALLLKLSKLRVVVPAEAAAIEDFDVRRNEASIGRILWGKDVPVDPGRHSISASAPQREPWSTTVLVGKPGEVVTVDVPMLKIASASKVGDVTRETGRDENAGGWMTARTAIVLGGISGGIAALGVGVGIGFTVAANDKSSYADSLGNTLDSSFACYRPTATNARTCADLKESLVVQGLYSRAAVASFTAAGVFAVGAGALMLYTSSTAAPPGDAEKRPMAQFRMVPVVDSTQKGLFLVGTW